MATWKQVLKDGDERRTVHINGRFGLRESSYYLINGTGAWLCNSKDNVETEDIPLAIFANPYNSDIDYTVDKAEVRFATSSSIAINSSFEVNFKRLGDADYTTGTSDNTTHDLDTMWETSKSPLNQNRIEMVGGAGLVNANGQFTAAGTVLDPGDALYCIVKAEHGLVGTPFTYYALSIMLELKMSRN
ncbi:MAG: hypothetical protein Unbinned5123contig1000_5 [Prokaryotic dsDNA virus sp.]|nr:MAG: hypothetical protein Unbinned5123contig1000_5 [Prokaryotic dsDNA virus sp.]|tara:strand:- start:694 stop:1257 length:564 start_codon:yes stop_codon:yes gene_type:complete